jgi:peptidyl-prolyl cis-trans isomerase C
MAVNVSSSEAAAGGATSSSSAPSPLRRLRREPLFYFLLIGALLFGIYRFLHPETGGRDLGNRIVVTEDDLRQMTVQWAAQGRPPPTPEQWRSLVETKVREEMLYREAVALGLDRDDTIVKRRMAQKMEFLAEDLSGLTEPTPAELKQWYSASTTMFALPPRASFRHIYFSPDRRNARARDDAQRALGQLAGKAVDAPLVAAAGDPFMFQDYYADRSSEQVAGQFGLPFARALFELKPGLWQGPVESGYGWHLVFVEQVTSGRIPAFEEIQPEVRGAWIEQKRAETKRNTLEAMRARYEVVLPPAPGAVAATNR